MKFNSLAEFKSHLKNNDVKFEVIKKKITIEILWNRLIFNKFSKNVKIDREQIKTELNNSNIKKELLLSEILFTVENNENLVDKYKLIVNNINEKNFDKAASIHSISDTSKNGGKLYILIIHILLQTMIFSILQHNYCLMILLIILLGKNGLQKSIKKQEDPERIFICL